MTAHEVLALADLVRARHASVNGYGRALRALAGLTLQDAADRTGVTPPTVHRWETGEAIPHGVNAIAYARFLAELRRIVDGLGLELEVPA